MYNSQPSPFIIFNASAGAGKTHTLVRSFLYRLLSNPYPSQLKRLLAITFTNKAAQEMKTRILTQLEGFANNVQDKMFAELEELCDLPAEDLQKRSKKAYLFILHHYGHFNVSTIDKLTHQIIRTFARDFGINPRFDVALDSKDFMKEVVDRILSKAGEDSALTKTLVDYVLQKSDELKSWDVTKEVNNIAQMFVNENHMQSLALLSEKPMKAFKELDKKIATQIKTMTADISNKATPILAFLLEAGIEDTFFPHQSLPKLLRDLQSENWPKAPLNKTLLKSIETGSFLKAEAKQYNKQLTDISDTIIALLQLYNQQWNRVALLKLLRRNIVPLSLMQHIGLEVNALQQERNTRLLGFFNKQISENIKGTPTPFIYERLGVRFQHFFIDEFQDTSELQWSNLHPLFSNAIEDDQSHGSLVLVGDAKQSIYRWRGGNPEQFMRLANKEVPFSIAPVVADLPINFRSAENIVSFNNSFFTKASSFLPLIAQQQLYAQSCDQKANKKGGGYITISTVEGSKKEEQIEAYQKAVVSRVIDCVEQGYAHKDICVLVRKNKQGERIAKALTEAGISITSTDSLLVGQSPEVQFLMHLVKLRAAPKSQLSRYAVLERFALQKEDPFSWTQQQFTRAFSEVLLELTDKKFDFLKFQRLGLYAALEYAIWSFSLTEMLTAHIQAFLDEVLKLEQKKEATTTQLLAHWEQNKDTWKVLPPEGRNAVQIMTLHKSKGLAFPVVILPFSDSAWMDSNTDYAWFPLPKEDFAPFEEMLIPISPKLETLSEAAKAVYQNRYAQAMMDTLNTLYVGMTRPIEELHILTTKGKEDSPPKNLSDVFVQAFPELTTRTIVTGERCVSKIKTPLKAAITTPWAFNEKNANNTIPRKQIGSEDIKYGLLFHEIMANVEVPQDTDYAIAMSNAKEVLSEKMYNQLHEQVNSVVHHERLFAFFDPANKVFCERPLLTATGEIVRPDRFVLTKDNEALLLDYKTGNYDDKHARQIEEYGNILHNSSIVVKQKVLIYVKNHLILKEV